MKLFPASFFSNFIQPSPPPIAKLASLHQFPPKNCPNSLWLASHVMTLKSPPNQYALPCPIYITTMIRRHTKFSSSFTNLTIISVFDTYLTPRSLGAWYQVWVSRPSQAPTGVWTKILLILNVVP